MPRAPKESTSRAPFLPNHTPKDRVAWLVENAKRHAAEQAAKGIFVPQRF